jgi:hypothetical protein
MTLVSAMQGCCNGRRHGRRCVRAFDAKCGLSAQEFLRRHEDDELPEPPDYAEWVGEQRLLERLREKARTLEEIRFAD